MRRETRQERAAWTAFVEGNDVPPRENKYHAERAGRFASKHEADVATKLTALASRGLIRDLQFQVPIVLAHGKGTVRPVKYIADFSYINSAGRKRYLDAKGFRTPVFKLKKRLALLLLGIEIEEV